MVLPCDTGFSRSYGRNPYVGYDRVDQPPFLFDGDQDDRLLSKESVAAIDSGDVSAALHLPVLESELVVNYPINEPGVAVFFKPGAVSALDKTLIVDAKDIGATGVFDAYLDGETLTFSLKDGNFIDDQTGATWNILGEGLEGEMAGKSLTPIVHGNHFWFAWGALYPETLIYRGVS